MLYAMTEKECPICGQQVSVVNYAVENYANGRSSEVGYLESHHRPGVARTSRCRGSFGGWIGRSSSGGWVGLR